MKRKFGKFKKQCLVCQEYFTAQRSDAQCCSATCRSRLSRGSIGRPFPTWDDLLRAEERKLQRDLFQD